MGIEDFENMEQIKDYLTSIKGKVEPELYESIEFLLGMRENKSQTVPVNINGEEIPIDRAIASLVAALNERGISTLASCSGVRKDHAEGLFNEPNAGYLSLAYNESLFEYLQGHIDDALISIECGKTFLQESIVIRVDSSDDTITLKKWQYIEEVLNGFVK